MPIVNAIRSAFPKERRVYLGNTYVVQISGDEKHSVVLDVSYASTDQPHGRSFIQERSEAMCVQAYSQYAVCD